MKRSFLVPLLVAVLFVLAGCGAEPRNMQTTAQEVTQEVEVTRLVEVTREVEVTRVDEDGWSVADLSAFEAAFESGEYEQVRALFTDDGILTTAANTHLASYRGEAERGAGVDGAEFRRIAAVHGGEDFTILGTPIQVGDNTVAFGWHWSSGYSGTALLHLRDGKIVIAVINVSEFRIPPGGG